MAGLAAAAARGRQGGRRPVVTPGKLERARALLAQGLNVREAAARLKLEKPRFTTPSQIRNRHDRAGPTMRC